MSCCEPYADYYFYEDTYMGNLIAPEEYDRLLKRAWEFICYYTRSKAETVTDERTKYAVRMACCAVAEQYYMIETAKATAAQSLAKGADGGEIQSETVGSYSVTKRSGGDTAKAALSAAEAARASLSDAARRYLGDTGLLYRGGSGKCTHHTP